MSRGSNTRRNSLLVGVLLGLGIGALLLGAGWGVRHWRANRPSENPDAPLLGGSAGPKPAVPPAGEPPPPTPAPPVGETPSVAPAPTGSIGASVSQMPRGTPEPTDSPPSASVVELPETVRRVLDNPAWRPKLNDEIVPAPLPAAAEALLVERYRAISSLSNKWRIIVILARSGSEAVVPLLTHAITNEFAGQVFSNWEADYFPRLLDRMGWQAQRHRSAYEFLEAACEPSFWEERPLPQVPDMATFKALLVKCALLGLAISGRPEALAFFEGIRSRPTPGWQGNPGSVVDAVFWYHFVQKHGLEKLRASLRGIP